MDKYIYNKNCGVQILLPSTKMQIAHDFFFLP